MFRSRLMTVFVCLLLIAGQLAGGVHLASHAGVEPVPWQRAAMEPLFVHDAAGHNVSDDHAHPHRGHPHAGAPSGKVHNKDDCTLCHLASNFLVVPASESGLPLYPVTGIIVSLDVGVSLAAADPAAQGIRGPPAVFLT